MIKYYASNDNSQISPHFKVSEFKCKCGGTHQTMLDTELVNKLETLYKNLNCSMIVINSGYRCATHDRNVGGSGRGQHCNGTAADIMCYDKNKKPINPKRVACAAQDIGFNGIGRINTVDSTHVDVRSSNRWYGDETLGAAGTNYTVTSNYYQYYGLTKEDVYGSSAAIPTTTTTPSTSTSTSHSWTNKANDSIKELQTILNSKGATLTVDGIAGENTLQAVKQYTINEGDQGELTKWVQNRLNSLGFKIEKIDGVSGAKTMEAISSFQTKNKLGTGYLGGEDWYYLIKD